MPAESLAARLGPDADVAELTEALIDIESVSGNELRIVDEVEAALSSYSHIKVERFANTVVARVSGPNATVVPGANAGPGVNAGLGGTAGRGVVIAGHLDTVPENANLPSRRVGDRIYGLGACDMKSGDAVMLKLAVTVPEPSLPVTYVFYDNEEVEAEKNGLGKLAAAHPELLAAEFAVLMEPSSAQVEAGCQGTLRASITLQGKRSHSARSWMGVNAIHAAEEVLRRLSSYEPRKVEVDGLVYREGLNAVGVTGGVAGNVIPDECVVTVNYRFAPSRSEEEALAHVREVFDGYPVEHLDSAPGALPGLDRPSAKAFLAAVEAEPKPKFGWTDVARFTALGVPAVNYGPGDPSLAHSKDEFVEVSELYTCENRLRSWLTSGAGVTS